MKELKWTGHYHKREDGIGEDVHWMPYPHKKKEPTPYYKTSTSFTLTKTIEYDNMDVLREHADNLERLQNEKFTLFHVPEFEFVVCIGVCICSLYLKLVSGATRREEEEVGAVGKTSSPGIYRRLGGSIGMF